MFPALVQQLVKNSKSKAVKERWREKVWMADVAPINIEQVYSSIKSRLVEAKKDIDELEANYYYDEQNTFDTLNFYSEKIHAIKDFCGVGEVKSLKTIKEIIKVVRLNMKYTNKDELNELLDHEFIASTMEFEKSFSHESQKSDVDKLPPVSTAKTNETTSAWNKPIVKEPTLTTVTVDGEISDEEPEEDSRKKNGSGSKFKKEFPVNLQNNVDPFISPLLKAAKLRSNLYVKDSDMENLEILEEFTENLCEAINFKFLPVMKEIDSICNVCDKYLLSFLFETLENFQASRINNDKYQIDNNFRFDNNRIEVLLNSSIRYDNKRLYYKDFVKSCLDDLRMLQRNFDDGTYNGVDLEDFSSESKRLCNRFDAHTIPILLIIPEYILLLNKCVGIMGEWLQYDIDYIGLIEEDIKVLEKRKKNMQSVRHNQKQIFNQLTYRLKTARSNIEKTKRDYREIFQRMATKQRWVDVDFEEKNQVIVNFQRELSKQKSIRDSKYTSIGCNSMLDMVENDLATLESDIVKFKAGMNSIKPKRILFDEKQTEIETYEQTQYDVEDQLHHFFEIKKVNPNELVILENCYLKLKEIHMYKSSCDTLRKVHFDLPLTSLKFGLTDKQYMELLQLDLEPGEINDKMPIITKHDQLNIAMHIISTLLENDWIKFYYTLPFTPERGATNIKQDIDNANFKFNRGDVTKERSLHCLQKWKRTHSRARLDDLRESLKKIGRLDILNELNEQLNAFDNLVVRKENQYNGQSKQRLKEQVYLTPEEKVNIQKRKEAEILHQKLEHFFEKRKIVDTPKTYKFHSSYIK